MLEQKHTQGSIIGVGLGPGAADLMSVRADNIILLFFESKALRAERKIVSDMISADAEEIAMEYRTTEIPVSDPRYNALLSSFYAACAEQLYQLTCEGHDVIVLCEGDPFFYGSFMHLHNRLKTKCSVQTIAGITAMSAAWTATDQPITWGDDVMMVLTGTMPEEELSTRLAHADAVVVMKIGRHLAKVKRALQTAHMHDRAMVVCYAAMPEQTVQSLASCTAETLPYFSIIIVHGQGRRP